MTFITSALYAYANLLLKYAAALHITGLQRKVNAYVRAEYRAAAVADKAEARALEAAERYAAVVEESDAAQAAISEQLQAIVSRVNA